MVYNCNKEVIYYWMPLDISEVEVLLAEKSKGLVRNVMITSIWAAVSRPISSWRDIPPATLKVNKNF